jgi:hypothetical protein
MPLKGRKQSPEHIRKKADSRRGKGIKINDVIIDEIAKTCIILMTQKKSTIIDLEDYDRVKGYRWTPKVDHSKNWDKWYANSGTGIVGTKHWLLHRLILGAKENEQTDHIDGDGLNNRKANLRIATNQQNQANSEKVMTFDRKPTSSKYIGVSKHGKKWQAGITKDGETFHCGTFDSQEDAAKARNAKATELYGIFAKLNI